MKDYESALKAHHGYDINLEDYMVSLCSRMNRYNNTHIECKLSNCLPTSNLGQEPRVSLLINDAVTYPSAILRLRPPTLLNVDALSNSLLDLGDVKVGYRASRIGSRNFVSLSDVDQHTTGDTGPTQFEFFGRHFGEIYYDDRIHSSVMDYYEDMFYSVFTD